MLYLGERAHRWIFKRRYPFTPEDFLKYYVKEGLFATTSCQNSCFAINFEARKVR
jgi:hypothetical protein